MALSLSDLIARKQKITGGKDVYVDALGGEIHINKLSAKRVADVLAKAESDDMSVQIDAFVDIIYASCPIFHKKELQDAYNCKVPEDVVLAVLDERIDTLAEIAGEIMSMYVGTSSEIKNS